jgi:hypothetical protein
VGPVTGFCAGFLADFAATAGSGFGALRFNVAPPPMGGFFGTSVLIRS